MPGNHLVSDLELVKNWVNLLHQDTEEMRRIVLLEVEARLLRLAIDIMARESAQHPAEPLHPSLGTLGRFEKMVTLLARHFSEQLSIADIAEAVR